MNALLSHAIAAKIVVGAVITAAIVALSAYAPARVIFECARGALGCK